MNDQPTPESNASLRATFATPVIECLLPNADTLNAELKRVILEREKGDKGTQHSNLGGWQSGWDMAEWGGDAFDEIQRAAHAVVIAGRFTRDRIRQAGPGQMDQQCLGQREP